MYTNLLKLAAKRDFTMVAGGGSFVQSLLKPISIELNTAQALFIKSRQKRMRELYERETSQQLLDIKRLNLMLKTNICHYRWTPLGMCQLDASH
ncbi:GH13923 [Drosophila grimshawi]|uniref:GH13923 n=1 Tax=Drosophila grimshawi TaxID=7222 RepID=B4K133_DROGR|nr:GH13923 [Drosophila grimshawi]